MKKIILALFIFFGFFHSAFALSITSHSSLQTNCDGGIFPPLVIYGTDTYHLWDYINTTREGIISGNSEVSVYVRNNKANIPNNWVQVSNYMPSAGQFYAIWNNGLAGLNIPALVPADRDVPVAQIVYRVRRMLIGVNNTYNYNGNYTYANFSGTTPIQTNLGNLNKNFDPSTIFVDNECISVLPRWCGDSVLDSANGETCDFNDASHTGWGVGGCDASCQPISGGGGGASCIPGPTVGAQPAPVTAATVGLCPSGQTVGSFTSTVAGSTNNYTWSCNGSPVGGSCSASYTPGGGGGGGGGGCGNGILEAGEQCDDGNTLPGDGCSATCTIEGGGSTPSGGGVTTPGSSSYCGNGIVERPNRDGQYETCDTVASWCVDCTVTSTTPGSTLPGDLTITTPGSSPVSILGYRLIIGDGVPVFSPNDIVSFRTNTPMYLQNKTATITNNSPLIEGTTVPKIINDQGVGGPILFEDHRTYDASGNLVNIVYNQRIYPNILPLFDGDELQNFRGKIDSFADNPSIAYRDTSSSPANGFYASLQYLTAPFHIRVAKPLVSNTAGGNAFIAQSVGYSVDTVVHNFLSNLANGNFTTTTVNVDPSYALSSSTRSLAGNTSINTIIGSGADREQSSIQKSSLAPSGLVLPDVYIANLGELISKSEKFADTESVRVFKNANVTIGGDVNLTGVRTIIIENGNLFINADITYADKDASFAWVVKNGNIIVRHDVENIAGVYVTLAGSIKSDGTTVPDRLSVDGSLYGDTSDLVANRSYVRGETGYTALNVGVVINYSNRALINPPPLLSRFLEQYSLQKVAK